MGQRVEAELRRQSHTRDQVMDGNRPEMKKNLLKGSSKRKQKRQIRKKLRVKEINGFWIPGTFWRHEGETGCTNCF